MSGMKLFSAIVAAVFAVGIAAPASAQQLCSSPLGDVVCSAGIGGGLGAALGGQKGAQWGAGIGAGLSILNQAGQPRYAPQPTYVAPQPTYVAPAPTYVVPAQPTYVVAPPPAPRYSYRRTYEPAYPHELVYSIQGGLHQLGYNPGPVDGAYGSRTGSAIRDYQRDNGLLVDGKPSSELYAHMQQFL